MPSDSVKLRNQKNLEQLDNLKAKVEEALSQVDFVVGYGLDYNGLGRDLDCIYRKKA